MSKLTQIVVVKNERGQTERDWVAYEKVDIEKYDAMEGEKALSHSFLLDSFRKLMGRTLTIIDASTSDKQQNKAMKDLVRTMFSGEMEFASDIGYDQKILTEMANKAFKNATELPESVTIEEALGVEA